MAEQQVALNLPESVENHTYQDQQRSTSEEECKLTVDAEGTPGFITYGTTTGVDDETIVTYPYVLGRYQGNIPGLGSFFNFMPTENNLYGCELDNKAYKVAKYLYPDANIVNGDIRLYQPGILFDYVLGNPPK